MFHLRCPCSSSTLAHAPLQAAASLAGMVVAAQHWDLLPELFSRCAAALTSGAAERASATASAALDSHATSLLEQESDPFSRYAQQTASASTGLTAAKPAASERRGRSAIASGSAHGSGIGNAQDITPAAGLALATALLCRLTTPAGEAAAAGATRDSCSTAS